MHGTRNQSLTSLVHRLVVGVVVLAVLTIPVECAASDGPHSVFLSPSEAGVARENGAAHDHSVPATSANAHEHGSRSVQPSTGATDEVATDVESQRGMSGFDIPLTINTPAMSALERAHVNPLVQITLHERVTAEAVVAPDPPPPR